MAQLTRSVAVAALVCGVAAGGMALARGPDMNLQLFGPTPGMDGPSFTNSSRYDNARYAPRANYDDGADVSHRQKRRAAAPAVAAFGSGAAVCVRLCDGFFFPTASLSGGEAACASQCPDAPTALYSMPSDKIEDAVSSTGEPYTRLPVAKRYQTTLDNTCSCHRDPVASRAKQLLDDPTLRRGDVVMTADGFRVYEGSGYGRATPRDFVALGKARLPTAQRAELAQMERASAGSPALSAPTFVVTRPKGNVTVDDGSPAPVR